jgi:hypothetical protein
MANKSARLQRWTDPVLGDLAWDDAEAVWNGSCEFGGQVVRLQLDPDNPDPTRDEQLAVIEPSRAVLDRLRQVELEFRRRAAAQIAAAVVSQQPRGRGRVTLPEDRFAAGLELETISIHGCGELHYRSPEFFPGWRVTVYFNEDLSFGDAEVYEDAFRPAEKGRKRLT